MSLLRDGFPGHCFYYHLSNILYILLIYVAYCLFPSSLSVRSMGTELSRCFVPSAWPRVWYTVGTQ